MIAAAPGEIFGKVLDILKNFQKDFPAQTQAKVQVLITDYLDEMDAIMLMPIDTRDDFRKLKETLIAFKDTCPAKISNPVEAETFYDTAVVMPFAKRLIKKQYLAALQAHAKRIISASEARALQRESGEARQVHEMAKRLREI